MCTFIVEEILWEICEHGACLERKFGMVQSAQKFNPKWKNVRSFSILANRVVRWVAPQIYIFHIYTGPKFTKPTFTQNPDLHKLKFTQLRFTHTQIYTAQYWHTQIYTTQIYTKLNPNLQRHKFTLCQTVQSAKLGRM